MLPDCKVDEEKKEIIQQPTKAQQLNKQIIESLQITHYTLDSTSNGPPRGWLNLRTRGLPFSQWARIFFFIQVMTHNL